MPPYEKVVILNMGGPDDGKRLAEIKAWFAEGAYYALETTDAANLERVLGNGSYLIILGRPDAAVLALRKRKLPGVRTFIVASARQPGEMVTDASGIITTFFAADTKPTLRYPVDFKNTLVSYGILRGR